MIHQHKMMRAPPVLSVSGLLHPAWIHLHITVLCYTPTALAAPSYAKALSPILQIDGIPPKRVSVIKGAILDLRGISTPRTFQIKAIHHHLAFHDDASLILIRRIADRSLVSGTINNSRKLHFKEGLQLYLSRSMALAVTQMTQQ